MKSFPASASEYKNEITDEIELPNVRLPSEMSEQFHKSKKTKSSTAVFTRRRYRDKWNRIVVRRVSKKHNHSIKIKACVRPRGVRSLQWYPAQRVAHLRKKCRTQSLWNLHLAGASMRGVLPRLPSSRALAKTILLVGTPLSHRRFSPLGGDEGPSCTTPAYDAGQTLEYICTCLVCKCCN